MLKKSIFRKTAKISGIENVYPYPERRTEGCPVCFQDTPASFVLESSARRLASTRSSMPHPRLSPETQAEIVHLLSRTRLTQTSIAAVCDVAQSTVCRMAREIGIAPWARKGKYTSPALASRNREIVQLAGAGISYAEIGRRFGISRERTRRIVERYASLLGKSA